MEYVSVNGNLRLPIRSSKEPLYDEHGRLREEGRAAITVEFANAGFPPVDYMRDRVRSLPEFGKGCGDVNEDPFRKCGYFNIESEGVKYGWTDEDKQFIVHTLDTHHDNGVGFLKVERPRVAPPWPKYDSARSVGSILSTVESTGVDPAVVILYESENRNRVEVIEAMQRLIDGDVTEPAAPAGKVEVAA